MREKGARGKKKPWDHVWKHVETPHGKISRPVARLCMTKFDRELWETRSG